MSSAFEGLDKGSIVTPRARSGNRPNTSWSSTSKPPRRLVSKFHQRCTPHLPPGSVHLRNRRVCHQRGTLVYRKRTSRSKLAATIRVLAARAESSKGAAAKPPEQDHH